MFLRFIKKPRRTKPISEDPYVQSYIFSLHQKYVIVPIDKGSNNVAFVCKTYYVHRTLLEIGIPGGNSDTYCLSNKDIKDILENNMETCKNFGFKLSENEKYLPLMYWIPKMQKNSYRSEVYNCIQKM